MWERKEEEGGKEEGKEGGRIKGRDWKLGWVERRERKRGSSYEEWAPVIRPTRLSAHRLAKFKCVLIAVSWF